MAHEDLDARIAAAQRTGGSLSLTADELQYVRRRADELGLHVAATVPARSAGDCMRVATVAAYGAIYGFDYDSTPTHDPHDTARWQAEWETWARDLGLHWWVSHDWAPIHLEGWIATVDGADYQHAVAMTHTRLLADSNAGSPAAYTAVDAPDVRCAKWLLPIGEPPLLPGAPCWWLPNPGGTGSNFHVSKPPRTPHPPRVLVKVGRNDPCLCESGKKFKRCCGVLRG